jgi:hypothetical protein
MVRAYLLILQQFNGNLNCKKVFVRRSPFSSLQQPPNHSKLGRTSPGGSSSQEFNPSIQKEKDEKGKKEFISKKSREKINKLGYSLMRGEQSNGDNKIDS